VTLQINPATEYPGTQVQQLIDGVSQQFHDKMAVLEEQRNAALTRVADLVSELRWQERQSAVHLNQFNTMVAQITDLQERLARATEPKT
jgi:hypothetical protein